MSGEKSVEVPIFELVKLEKAREDLYSFLGNKLTPQELSIMATITSQIWRVANTKKW